MTAKQQNLYRLFMVTVAVILIETTQAYEHRPDHDGPASENHRHNHSADNDAAGERKFSWPGSIGISIHREEKVDGPANEPVGNDTDSQRKFHWPSSATLTIHRAGQVGSDSAQQVGANGTNSSDHDTDSERKFHWPGTTSITFSRTGQVNSDSPNGPINQAQSGPGNSPDGERKFHWPSSVGITINRAGQALHHEGDEPQLPEGFKLEQLLYGSPLQVVSCNHTSQPGLSCVDCTHTLLCFFNNVGIKRDCGQSYCDNGRCSPQPTAACNETSNA